MSINHLFIMQVATHLKGLAEKAKLNEKHVRIARIYKAKVAALTSERTELQGRVQHMTEEMERLRSDLRHTSSARARAESREVEVRSSPFRHPRSRKNLDFSPKLSFYPSLGNLDFPGSHIIIIFHEKRKF